MNDKTPEVRGNQTATTLYFTEQGYSRVRNMAYAYKRSMCTMVRLLVATMLREDKPTFNAAEYSPFDMTYKLPITLDTIALNRLARRATNRSIPYECIGEMISNFDVPQ